MMMFSLRAVLYSSPETGRQPALGGEAAYAREEDNAATATTTSDTRSGAISFPPNVALRVA
jgi:hypothetical protein